MPTVLNIVFAVILIIAAAIWLGGYFTVALVAIVSARTHEPDARVRFFKRFGRAYLALAGIALVVSFIVGWILLTQVPWGGAHTRIAIASTALILTLGAGVLQARDLTRRRARLALDPQNAPLAQGIKTRARFATALRALIGVFSLAIVIHAAVLLA